MANTTIIAPPLQDVREALWTRLTTHADTSGYTWMKEGHPAEMPYLAIGPAYKGSGGSDPDDWAYVVIQIDAYAEAKAGGSNKVSTMIEDVYTAISSSGIEFGGYAPMIPTIEDDVLNTNQWDGASKELYAQRFVRIRFLITP